MNGFQLVKPKRKSSSHKHVEKQIQTYNCQVCSKPFAKQANLKRHLLIHEERKFKCQTCGKKFTQASNLKRHERIHTGEKPYKCGVCPKSFSKSSNLHRHTLVHSREKPYRCAVCDKEFAQKANLDAHLRVHTGEMPFCCEQCNKRFKQRAHLKTHVKAVHLKEVSRFKCVLCLKTLHSAHSLNRHMNIHTGEKPYQCHDCGKRFRHRYAVVCHLRTHTGEKPFACEICGKRFSQGGNLSNHIRIHLGEKFHKCPVCLKEFFTPLGLRYHKQSIHGTGFAHTCIICDKNFHFLHHLKKHVHRHTREKPFTCRVCGAEFSEKCNARRHKQTHLPAGKAFECIICMERVSTLRHLLEHTKTHTHERPFYCKFCGEASTVCRQERKCCKTGAKH